MAADPSEIRAIAWTEVFPWLMIFRSFSLAISMPMLVLATVGVLLTPIGWIAGESFLSVPEQPAPVARDVAVGHTWPFQSGAWQRVVSTPGGIRAEAITWTGPIQQVCIDGLHPFRQLFERKITWQVFGYYLVGGVWSLLIWSVLGGAMTRMAVVRLGRNDREGMFEALGFAVKRFTAYFGAPLFPLVGVIVFVLLCIPIGALMRWDAGVFVAGILWFFVLLGSLLMTILLLGLVFGWPLMWGVTSVEEMGDVFEATQRSYSYTFGRPLHYLFYASLALLLGAVGFQLVRIFAEGVVALSYWAVSWGAGNARLAEINAADSDLVFGGHMIIQFLNGLVVTVASAYRYSFFWSAVAATYLLLRRNVDQTEFDDIFVLGAHERYGLPELTRDEKGVPGVPEDASET